MRTVLDNSVAFSLLFAGVWLVKAGLRKHLSAQLHYLIWAAVLVSLLVPVRIETGVSLWNLLPRQAAESILQQTQNLQPVNAGVHGADAGEGTQLHDPPAATGGTPAGPPSSGQASPVRTGPVSPAARVDWLMLLQALWLAGAATAVLWLLLGGARLRRRIDRCGSPDTPAWLRVRARECAGALRLRRHVRVVVQPVLPMPAVMGVFRPMLAMPESVKREGGRDQVRHILMHEFSHVRRGDLAVIALLNLLCAVYWFNPLVWLCCSLVRADMETACDNDVINALGRGGRQDYIRTLVHFSGMGGGSRAQAALSLNDAGIRMKKRIGGMFMTKKTKPIIAVPVVLLVTVLLVAASATGCLPVESGAALTGSSATAAMEQDTATTAPTDKPEPTATPGIEAQMPEPTAGPNDTTEENAPATTKPEKTQAAAVQWETRYQPVLDEYRNFAASIKDGKIPDMGEPWNQIAPDAMYSTKKFGYALRDMDGNGTPELFLLTSDGSIWAMYTFAGGAPRLLGTYWPRNSCVLDGSDVIYTNWSNGALDCGQDAYRISKDGMKLELIKRIAVESTDENGKSLDEPRYYKCSGSGDDKQIITKAEADAETSDFPKDNDHSGLKFLPLN